MSNRGGKFKKNKAKGGKPERFKDKKEMFVEANDNGEDDANDNFEDLPTPKKWYEEYNYEAPHATPLTPDEIQKLKREASSIYDGAVILNNSKKPKSISNTDYLWIKTVLSRGTSGDKVAASTLLIQDSPTYNIGLIKNMISMVKISKKNECYMVIDALRELFITDLLPPDRKLIPFSNRPLSKLNDMSSGNISLRKKILIAWYFEDQLKEQYRDFVGGLCKAAHDSVEANKDKVITIMSTLLEKHPEQEAVLLSSITNKLGDPNHKIGSKVIFCLTRLLRTHPNMKEVVANEVEKVIFRSNISKRAQYYSICFLTQFVLTADDCELAKKLIKIYFSLFKACIKLGDVETKLSGALLTGVKRAYPFAKDDCGMLTEHINTLYKLVHLSRPNIGIDALSLLFLVSDYSNSVTDRFYSVLYKKISDPYMFQATHQAMFLNLIFKALRKDKDINRVCAFIKRILQVCNYVTVPIICGLLFMVSELTKFKKGTLKLTQEATSVIKIELPDEEDDDGLEHFKDVPLDSDEVKEEPQETNTTGAKTTFTSTPLCINMGSDVKKEEPEDKTEPVTNVVKIEKSFATSTTYNPYVRNPSYAHAENSSYVELLKLCKHFHPTVNLFANELISGKKIHYTGDPLQDFSLIRFLDKFSFKNPKEVKKEAKASIFDKRKSYTASFVRRLRVNSKAYVNLSENSIPAEEHFLYKFFKAREASKPVKKEEEEEDGSDVESVKSDEVESVMEKMMGGMMGDFGDDDDDLDFMNEVGDLSEAKKKEGKGKKRVVEEDDDDEEGEGMEGSEDEDEDEDDDNEDLGSFDGDEIDELGSDDDFDYLGDDKDDEFDDLGVDREELENRIKAAKSLSSNKKSSYSKKKKSFSDSNVFAPADEFSELLEQNDFRGGTSEAVSNKDRAGAKQLKWEENRNSWSHKKNFNKNSNKRGKMGKFTKGAKRRKLK